MMKNNNEKSDLKQIMKKLMKNLKKMNSNFKRN